MRVFKSHPLLKLVNSYLVDSPQPSNLSYLWNFGSLLGLCLVIQIITGVTLAMHYNPSISEAFNSVEHIMRDVNNGWLIRYLHSNTASAFFFLVYLHIGRGLYYGSYRAPRTLVWTLGTVIFILMIVTAFLGYVLPYGQMSLWGATVITNLMSAIPWIGQDIVEFIWGGFSVSNATLNRFFALHFVLPFILAALVLMHLIALHDSAGSNNPLGVSGNYDRLSFAPYFIFKDLITIFIFMIILSILVFFMPNMLGDSENYVMANPMQTPPAIVPEWYLLPFYAILRSIPNKLLGVVAMLSAILILLAMPFTDLSRSRGIQFRPLSKIAFYIFISNFIVLMILGAKHVESPFIEFGQISTVIYFSHFLIIVPLVSLVENSLIELPSSINEKILTKSFKTSGKLIVNQKRNFSQSCVLRVWDYMELGATNVHTNITRLPHAAGENYPEAIKTAGDTVGRSHAAGESDISSTRKNYYFINGDWIGQSQILNMTPWPTRTVEGDGPLSTLYKKGFRAGTLNTTLGLGPNILTFSRKPAIPYCLFNPDSTGINSTEFPWNIREALVDHSDDTTVDLGTMRKVYTVVTRVTSETIIPAEDDNSTPMRVITTSEVIRETKSSVNVRETVKSRVTDISPFYSADNEIPRFNETKVLTENIVRATLVKQETIPKVGNGYSLTHKRPTDIYGGNFRGVFNYNQDGLIVSQEPLREQYPGLDVYGDVLGERFDLGVKLEKLDHIIKEIESTLDKSPEEQKLLADKLAIDCLKYDKSVIGDITSKEILEMQLQDNENAANRIEHRIQEIESDNKGLVPGAHKEYLEVKNKLRGKRTRSFGVIENLFEKKKRIELITSFTNRARPRSRSI